MLTKKRRESVFADRALQNYLAEIAKYRTLTREEEHELAIKAKDGDQNAINTLIQSNLKFVVKIATRFQNRGLTLSELISEGNIGLIKAIEKFDPDKNIKLISYAIWWIKQRIMLAVSEKSSLIRVPLGKSSAVSKLRATTDRLASESGEAPSIDELIDATKLDEKAINQLKSQHIETLYIDDLNQQNPESSLYEFPDDDAVSNPQRIYYNERLQSRIARAISNLEPREADIIRMYFGLNDASHTQNFAQIAEEMGLSRERVRQIQKEALKKILHELQPETEIYADEFIKTYDHY